MKEMTQRHDMIQETIVEAVRKHRKLQEDEILKNKTISYGKFTKDLGAPTLSVNEDKQRPDIHFWANISQEEEKFETWKLFIIEIAIPFGKKDQEEEDSNSLKKAIEFKTNKYAPLIRNIRAQFDRKRVRNLKFVVEFIPIVISSLGAMPNKTINGITKIIGTATKNTVGIWCKKLVVKAIKGSFMIWVKAKPETLASNRKVKKEEEEDDDPSEREIREKVIQDIDEDLQMGKIGENEGEEENGNLIQELAMEKERMKELNLPENAPFDEMEEEQEEKYNRKSNLQSDVFSYKEVELEEEKHDIRKKNNKEILINLKPSAFPSDPETEEETSGINSS
jgi:hypothetical protein